MTEIGPHGVAIIGAGLAGTALALALHQQSIQVRLYEARSSDSPEIASGVVLTPNGLRVLDRLGVLARIADRCWKSEFRTYKNDKDETTRKTLIANEELYGYKNHRLWRRLLLDEMKQMLQERQVTIVYDTKYEGIDSDTAEGVTFRVNGRAEHASLLVGADGIYSRVRKHLSSVGPEHTGVVGVLGHVPWSSVSWPYPDYEKACTIQGKPGAIFFIPENADGSEIMVGKQVKHADQDRAAWEAMASDKESLCDFYRNGYDDWHSTAKSIIDSVCLHKDTFYLWPFLKMPRLDSWFSDTHRVIIIGDAAHAVPPSSGQGVNQSLEDVYALTLLLRAPDRPKALAFWQQLRQTRVDTVFDWATNATNVQRLPDDERKKMMEDQKIKNPTWMDDVDDMRWLYGYDAEQQIREWLESNSEL